MPKGVSPAPRSHGLHLFWGSLSHLEFAKSLGKVCISCLCTLFGGFVCHFVFYRMYFARHFHIFAMLSSSFCWKMDPALGIHIAQIWKANTTCEICRIYMSPWCRLAGIAGFELHALFRHPETALPIRDRRAAVLPSPEGLQFAGPLAQRRVRSSVTSLEAT